MIKEGKVSLWLGSFISREEFDKYFDIKYDEDGNFVYSDFQQEFHVFRYNLDAFEKDWISGSWDSLKDLLMGFSYDDQLIAAFDTLIKDEEIKQYNSVLLLYDYEHIPEKEYASPLRMDFIGCADFNKSE